MQLPKWVLPLISIALLLPHKVFADHPRRQSQFYSKNKRFVLQERDGRRWELHDLRSGKKYYEIPDDVYKHHQAQEDTKTSHGGITVYQGSFRSQTIWISDNGLYLIVFNDWPEADDDLPVLRFYNNGHLQQQYYLRDFIDDKCKVSISKAHMTWLLQFEHLKNNRFRFITTELYQFIFDVESGKLLHKRRPPWLAQRSRVLYGRVGRRTKGRYYIDIQKEIISTGSLTARLTFKVAPKERKLTRDILEGLPVTVILTDGKLDPHTEKVSNLLYNKCF